MVSQEADLFVALRGRLESPFLAVRWCDPEGAERTINECAPWPWAIVGDAAELVPPLVDLFARRPVLALWLGRLAPGLPSHASAHGRWTDLAVDLTERLNRHVFGLRLAPNRGLLTDDGALVLAPELEALVGIYPAGLEVPARALAPARAALDRQRLPLRLRRSGGLTTLIEVS